MRIEYPCPVTSCILSLQFFPFFRRTPQSIRAGDMTSTECYDLIKRGVDIEVPGLELYYDKVVCELRGWSNVFLVELLLCLYKKNKWHLFALVTKERKQ